MESPGAERQRAAVRESGLSGLVAGLASAFVEQEIETPASAAAQP